MSAPVFQLGALARLFPTVAATTAKWAGRGFNLIEIPDHTGQLNRPLLKSGSQGARLLTHMSTQEVWTFEKAGVVPNRTFRPPAPGGQPDQFTSAISYSQHVTAKTGQLDQKPVTDPTMLGTIHGEKGFLIFNPTPTIYGDPAGTKEFERQQFIRLGTIPHGVSIMLSTAVNGASSMQLIAKQEDFAKIFDGNSQFDMAPVSASGAMPTGPGYGETFFLPGRRPGVDQLAQDLNAAIGPGGQFIGATVIHMGTPLNSQAEPMDPPNPPNLDSFAAAQTNFLARPGSVKTTPHGLNMPFANARVDNVEFWWSFIDIANATGAKSTIVQYAQAISLNFAGLQWPHITGATLTLQPSIKA